MYRAVNNNTIQQCITKVIMADVINHMYFNYFYNVSEGYSRTLSLYKWYVSMYFYFTYHSVFPNPSLSPVMVVEGEGEAAWARCLSCTSFCRLASLSTLSLAICCRTASLWARSLALSSLIWFTIFCACLSSRSLFALPSSCPWWRLSNSFFLVS